MQFAASKVPQKLSFNRLSLLICSFDIKLSSRLTVVPFQLGLIIPNSINSSSISSIFVNFHFNMLFRNWYGSAVNNSFLIVFLHINPGAETPKL